MRRAVHARPVAAGVARPVVRVVRPDRHQAAVRAARGPERTAHQREVVAPVPVRPRVDVHGRHVAGDGAGDVVMAEDVRAVQRDVVPLGEVAHQPRRAAVHRLGVPGAGLRQEALVLDADGLGVDVPVARVPGDVPGPHVLGDVTVGRADRVVPAHVGGVGHQPEGLVVGLLGVVDDDVVDPLVARPVGQVVVAVVAGGVRQLLVGRGKPLTGEFLRALDGLALSLAQPQAVHLLHARSDLR